MRIQGRTLVGATALALAMTVGIGVAPVFAASASSSTVVTVKGHVRDAAGKPLKNITVESACGCDYEGGTIPKYMSGTDKTSSTGYFSYRVQKRYASNVSFTDQSNAYLAAGADAATITKRGTGFVIDAKLQLTSEVAGTVRDDSGAAVSGATILLFDATTGKEVGADSTDKLGRYHALVSGGSYKVKIVGASFYYTSEWLGDAPTREVSPTIAVAPGAKVAGVNATISKKQSIAGTVTIDGQEAISFAKETVTVTLFAADGSVVDRQQTDSNYGFSDLTPGTYTVQFAPSPAGYPFFATTTRTVVLTAGARDDVTTDLVSVPPTAGAKSSAAIDLAYPEGKASKGKAFHGTVTVSSYGTVAGGKVEIYADGTLLTTKTVPVSGVVKFGTRFTGVKAGYVTFRVKFTGTDTTAPRYLRLSTIALGK